MMIKYVFKRIGMALLTLLIITFLLFYSVSSGHLI